MHVIEPERYRAKPGRHSWWLYAGVVCIILIAAGAINYFRPLPPAQASIQVRVPTATTPGFSWPSGGQAAVAASGYGILSTSGDQTPLATASIAKVILALCVLQKQPMAAGETGATYTVGANDVAIYENYAAQDGSLVEVIQGEKLTEYQALQALLLPSANNIADSLVGWVFGSQATYAAYASSWLQQNGLDNTHIGNDASGFDPSTASTASDLAQLGLVAAKNPVLMGIAGQGTAVLPVAGTVWNYDTVRGQSGIDGLKTGNNDADPGAFLFTATTQLGSQTVRLSGTVMGAPDLDTALQQSVQLAASAEKGFEQATIVRSGQLVGAMHTAWGASSPITAAKTVQVVRWKATPITQTHHLDTSARRGVVGSLKASAGPNTASSPLQLAHPLSGPSFWWRLTRH